jgi:hypothetical protein
VARRSRIVATSRRTATPTLAATSARKFTESGGATSVTTAESDPPVGDRPRPDQSPSIAASSE